MFKDSKYRQTSFKDSVKTSGFRNNNSSKFSDCKVGCVLQCCLTCSFCTFTQASTKERIKSRSVSEQNKVCQRCMLCKSMLFCPSCSQCCHRTECRGKTTQLLASLAENGCKSSGGICLERGLHPSVQRPRLTRFPLVQSGYANPVKNQFLKEALVNLMNKLVVEKVVIKSSLAFYNRLFLVPKPNKKWRPILDLSQLNLYLSTNTFKMETPESIRLSLQTGDWVSTFQ